MQYLYNHLSRFVFDLLSWQLDMHLEKDILLVHPEIHYETTSHLREIHDNHRDWFKQKEAQGKRREEKYHVSSSHDDTFRKKEPFDSCKTNAATSINSPEATWVEDTIIAQQARTTTYMRTYTSKDATIKE